MSKTLKIVVAQLNFLVGDIFNNCERIITAAKAAKAEFSADLLVLPELALTGYPPEDLLFRQDFHDNVAEALKQLQQQITDIDVILGFPRQTSSGIYNTAGYIHHGKLETYYYKQALPNYGVFDEKRYFIAGKQTQLIKIKAITIGLGICEDLWTPEPIAKAKQAGAELFISINASPFNMQKNHQRIAILKQRISETSIPIISAHLIGGQDELVFDGGSLAIDNNGTIAALAPYHQQTLLPIDISKNQQSISLTGPIATTKSDIATIYDTLVLGIQDYINKNHFTGVIVGSSGGIDSALTLTLAVDALGNDNVESVSMPSQYTSQLSLDLATALAENLQIPLVTLPISACYENFIALLDEQFSGLDADPTEENLQARIRGTIMMALSNKKGQLVLTTGNKSELAVGYATLYGDMAGGFAPLKDVPKTLVYQLCQYRNHLQTVIPEEIITRPPTAELAPNQKDQDHLPPYPILDAILADHIELDYSAEQLIAKGFEPSVVNDIIRRVKNNEYKRRQAPPGIRITHRAFGRERRYPITSGFQSKYSVKPKPS